MARTKVAKSEKITLVKIWVKAKHVKDAKKDAEKIQAKYR